MSRVLANAGQMRGTVKNFYPPAVRPERYQQWVDSSEVGFDRMGTGHGRSRAVEPKSSHRQDRGATPRPTSPGHYTNKRIGVEGTNKRDNERVDKKAETGT